MFRFGHPLCFTLSFQSYRRAHRVPFQELATQMKSIQPCQDWEKVHQARPWSFIADKTHKFIHNLSIFQKYQHGFLQIGGWLLQHQRITDEQFQKYFWMGLPKHIHNCLEACMFQVHPTLPLTTPFPIELIIDTAEHVYDQTHIDQKRWMRLLKTTLKIQILPATLTLRRKSCVHWPKLSDQLSYMHETYPIIVHGIPASFETSCDSKYVASLLGVNPTLIMHLSALQHAEFLTHTSNKVHPKTQPADSSFHWSWNHKQVHWPSHIVPWQVITHSQVHMLPPHAIIAITQVTLPDFVRWRWAADIAQKSMTHENVKRHEVGVPLASLP